MFSPCNGWNNGFIPQTDQNEFHKFYNELSAESTCGGYAGHGRVCGKSGEIQLYSPLQPQQQQYTMMEEFSEMPSLNAANIYRTFPTTTSEESVCFNNNEDKNNNNKHDYYNSVQYETNACNQQNAFQNSSYYNNNNNSTYSFYRNENVNLQQYQYQQQTHQLYYNNFVNTPQQQQSTEQQIALFNPAVGQQLLPAPAQRPAATQHVKFQPPLTFRTLNYNENIYQNQQPPYHSQQYELQQQQFNQESLGALTPSIPCQGNQPWTYAYCYGYGPYANEEPCQFTQIVDIEDFMNNEKRKERSRDAARCRRSRETEIFTEMAQALPLKKEDVQQLDKASVMRIAISYLKMRDMLKMFPKIQELFNDLNLSNDSSNNESSEANTDTSVLNNSFDSNDSSSQSSQVTDDSTQQASVESDNSSPATDVNGNAEDVEDFGLLLKQTLDGFLLILSNEGDITYVTGNISDYLGLSKIDILGQQIWEYAHQCDHAELKEALNIKRNRLAEKIKGETLMEEGISTDHRDLFVRLKCTITSRGRSINIKSASYKVIHITGHLVVNTKGDRVLVAMGRPIPHPCNIEVPLGTSTFLTKHSLDMTFTYVDDKMFNLLGYKPEDLLETSLFNCHHGIDSDSLMTTFKNVLSKGQGETCRYRFLGKYGGYCWIVTQATIVYDKLKPQSVVCVNFVISNLEKKDEIYTLQQYEESQKLKLNDKPEILNDNKTKEEVIKDQLKEEKVYSTTEINDPLEPVATTTRKVESTTPPPTSLNKNNNNHNQQIINNNDNNINNKNLNEDIKNIQTIIKLEQIVPPPVVAINNNQSKLSTTVTVAETLNNSSLLPTTTTKTQIIKTVIVPPQQLPIVPHCPTTTVTHTIFNKTVSTSKLSSDDKRPKTVTSSLILTNLPTTTSTQSILQHKTLNVTTRAPQSVTASVFSPLPPPKLPSTTATAAILAQQTQTEEGGKAIHQQDMNKGYLSFAEDATELTMLKEEPDDLTAHLVATNAVDACMPLDESGPLFGEILVGFSMGSYGSLLPDDINSLDSNNSSTDPSNNNNNNNNNSNNQTILKSSCTTNTCSSTAASSTTSSTTSYNAATSSHNLRQSSSPSLITTTTCATNNNNVSAATANSTNIDPFINYRDESNDTNYSQHLLSPSVTSKSPEGSSLPSLCSPNSLSQEDEFSYYTMNVDDMDDLTMRAPYIPMNEQDDLPLLTSDDYMWSSGNAFTPDEFSLNTKDSDNLQVMQINQSLNYQQQQFTQQQQQQTQQYSNSLCSSPASTVSSMSPSPLQQQQNSQQIFSADSSELAALLCGTGNGGLSILQDAENFTNSLNLNSGTESTLVGGGSGGNVNVNNCSNQNLNNNNNNSSNIVGADESGGGVGLNDDLDSVSMDHHQQLQQHCLQQFQEQLQRQHQHQRQQQLLSGLNINCKKEKFETTNNSPSLTPNLCDTIDDTFDNVVYSKNSTNLDCWNEFLQISSNDSTNTTNNVAASAEQQKQGMEHLRQEDCKQQLHMQLQQQQQTQNIILNAVPLITIETNASNNKNVLMPTLNNPQQQQQQQQLAPQCPQTNTKSLNKVNTIKLTPITSTATIKIIENKQQNSLLQQQQQQQQKQRQNVIKTSFIQATPIVATSTVATVLHSNNKRHLSATQIANNALDSKRIKSNLMDLQNSSKPSQLLQQLITTPQQHQQGTLNMKTTKGLLESRWSTSENQTLAQQQQQQLKQQQQQQQQQKQSNSVLKNLLISGCDKTDLTKPEITIIDNGSRSSMQSPELCLSPTLIRPLQCVTSTSALLRNYRHNPWIGGPGNLPSPTASLITNDDSNPPGLTSCHDAIDSASDSGIDDISIAENMSPLKRTFDQQRKQIENVFGMKAATIIANNNNNLNTDNTNNNNKSNETDLRKFSNLKIQDVLKANNTTKPNIAVMQEMELARKIDEFVDEEEEEEEEDGASICKRKKSLSYLDSSNPLMTPFLMDLCNDDYHMNTKEYLQENAIDNVLNEWPVELV